MTTWTQGSVSLAASAGQTITLRCRATTDSSYVSSFYIDDVSVRWGMLMAASVLMSIPAILVFAFAQKYIVQGLSEGAVKG